MANPVVWILLLVVMNLFWAGSYTVVKLGLGSMDALALVFWRLVLGLAIILCWLGIKRYPIKVGWRDGSRIAFAGLMLALSNYLWVTGINMSHATDASLLYVFEPIWGIILASIFLREKLRISSVAGLVIVLVGLACLSGFDASKFGFSAGSTGLGNLLIVAGLLAEGFFSIVLKPVASRRPAPVVTAGVLLVASALLAIPMGARGNFSPPLDSTSLMALGYLSIICTVVGYTVWVAVMKHVPVGVMLFSIFIQPITGPFMSWAALGEPIDSRVISGGMFLLTGMAVAVLGHMNASRRARSAGEDAAITLPANA